MWLSPARMHLLLAPVRKSITDPLHSSMLCNSPCAHVIALPQRPEPVAGIPKTLLQDLSSETIQGRHAVLALATGPSSSSV